MIIKMNDKMIPLPPELQTMYDETPGLSVNNSRQIIRETWANAMEKYEKTRDARRVVSYLKRKLGVTIDYDDKYDTHREPDYFKPEWIIEGNPIEDQGVSDCSRYYDRGIKRND